MDAKRRQKALGEAIYGRSWAVNHAKIDLSDRREIDTAKALILNKDKGFLKVIDDLREELNFPLLNKKEDLDMKDFITIEYNFFSVKSRFLASLPKKMNDDLKTVLYEAILKKYNLSFNFYYNVESYLLYKDFVIILPEPNPAMFENYQDHPEEMVRNIHTTSEIKNLCKQLRVKMKINGTPQGVKSAFYKAFKERISTNKNKNRRVRNYTQFNQALKLLNKEGEPISRVALDNIFDGDDYAVDTKNEVAKLKMAKKRIKSR